MYSITNIKNHNNMFVNNNNNQEYKYEWHTRQQYRDCVMGFGGVSVLKSVH